jgi:hypothetical protein
MDKKRLDYRIIFGVLLVLVGVFTLLETLSIVKGVGGLIGALLFAAGGAAFLYFFMTHRDQWWAIIPGFVLLGLAAVIAIETLPLRDTGPISGGVFLGSIGLAFWAIYLLKRDYWWALIPGGVLITLALVAALSNTVTGNASGGIFFLGLGATFGGIYFLPTADGRQKWAAVPALILGAIGLLMILGSVVNLSYVLPVALILAGAYFLLRALRRG